jgi:hypothetical protein
VFEIKIEEGLQFRMGTITFGGLSESDAALLGRRWQLKPGEIFDASYYDKYYAEEIQPRLPRGSRPPSVETRVDEANRVVNIRFVFGG